jgi:hypothetical protein
MLDATNGELIDLTKVLTVESYSDEDYDYNDEDYDYDEDSDVEYLDEDGNVISDGSDLEIIGEDEDTDVDSDSDEDNDDVIVEE